MMGVEAEVQLLQRGFYPRGGGKIVVRTRPVGQIRPLVLTERAKVTRVRGLSYSQGLPSHIAERTRESTVRALGQGGYGKAEVELEVASEGPSTGCGIALWAETTSGLTLGGNALGERGKPAERVGEEAARRLLRELQGKGAVDAHLADQLVVWMALAEGPCEITTSALTDHMRSAAEVAAALAGAKVTFEGEGPVRVRCAVAPG